MYTDGIFIHSPINDLFNLSSDKKMPSKEMRCVKSKIDLTVIRGRRCFLCFVGNFIRKLLHGISRILERNEKYLLTTSLQIFEVVKFYRL